MPNIPEELVEEILCRVPATSLKRLRSTCKQWKRLFNDTKFSRKHFDKAPKQYPVFVRGQYAHTLYSLRVDLHNGRPSAEITCELSPNHVVIEEVFHCDGLLVCTIMADSRIVVWNPCTGQTKWIKSCRAHSFALGNYQDNKTGNKSYKILSYTGYNHGYREFDIYDINSNSDSWRKLDHVTPIPGHTRFDSPVSLKGKTYWFVNRPSDLFSHPLGLICFDYTTERFESLRLPDQCEIAESYSLSVVGEEKLSVLLQHKNSSRSEVWITNKIDDENKEMSWNKLLEVEVGTGHDIWFGGKFVVDEEKKMVVYCVTEDHYKSQLVITVSIVGADSNATRGSFPVKALPVLLPYLVNYVPSLIQF